MGFGSKYRNLVARERINPFSKKKKEENRPLLASQVSRRFYVPRRIGKNIYVLEIWHGFETWLKYEFLT